MRVCTTVGRGATSVRTIVWGLVILAIMATVVYVKVRPPARRRVTSVTKVPVGPVSPTADREWILLLEIPADVHPDADEPGAFSLEYVAAVGEAMPTFGKCRIVVKDDNAVLGSWDGVPRGCDWHEPNPGGNSRLEPDGNAAGPSDTRYGFSCGVHLAGSSGGVLRSVLVVVVRDGRPDGAGTVRSSRRRVFPAPPIAIVWRVGPAVRRPGAVVPRLDGWQTGSARAKGHTAASARATSGWPLLLGQNVCYTVAHDERHRQTRR